MDAAVAPGGVLPREPPYQQPDGTHGPGASRSLRAGTSRVAAREQIPVPAQYGVRAYQQSYPAQQVPRQPVQHGRVERAITRGEPHSFLAELAFQDHDLMAQREELRVPVPIGHRQQAQHREGVRHGQVSQSQQHN